MPGGFPKAVQCRECNGSFLEDLLESKNSDVKQAKQHLCIHVSSPIPIPAIEINLTSRTNVRNRVVYSQTAMQAVPAKSCRSSTVQTLLSYKVISCLKAGMTCFTVLPYPAAPNRSVMPEKIWLSTVFHVFHIVGFGARGASVAARRIACICRANRYATPLLQRQRGKTVREADPGLLPDRLS